MESRLTGQAGLRFLFSNLSLFLISKVPQFGISRIIVNLSTQSGVRVADGITRSQSSNWAKKSLSQPCIENQLYKGNKANPTYIVSILGQHLQLQNMNPWYPQDIWYYWQQQKRNEINKWAKSEIKDIA